MQTDRIREEAGVTTLAILLRHGTRAWSPDCWRDFTKPGERAAPKRTCNIVNITGVADPAATTYLTTLSRRALAALSVTPANRWRWRFSSQVSSTIVVERKGRRPPYI
jgi:hypothetical protein